MRFCIVTPSFNQRAYLQQTARSILGQTGDFELNWFVVDGGSSDGTVEYLKSIFDPRVKWISEHDHGQADALNKGLRQADGNVIGWLNSDDLYVTGALSAVADALRRRPNAGWVVGQCRIIDAQGRMIRSGIAEYKNRRLRRYSYRRLLRENFIAQPAVFWRREWGQKVGPLDPSLFYTMDYDLWLRLGREGDPIVLDQPLAEFRVHASSKTGVPTRKQFDEDMRVADRYVGDDRASRWIHRFNVEKIVWAYRVMRLMGK
jgi:glycosyltransferase involved in cell wall biosynthesis